MNSYQLPSGVKIPLRILTNYPPLVKIPLRILTNYPPLVKIPLRILTNCPPLVKNPLRILTNLLSGVKKNTVVRVATVFWGGCAGYLNVRLPCCGLGRTMISRCRAVDSTFLATAATSCGVSVRKMGATLALSSGVSSSPVSA